MDCHATGPSLVPYRGPIRTEKNPSPQRQPADRDAAPEIDNRGQVMGEGKPDYSQDYSSLLAMPTSTPKKHEPGQQKQSGNHHSSNVAADTGIRWRNRRQHRNTGWSLWGHQLRPAGKRTCWVPLRKARAPELRSIDAIHHR